MRGAERAHVRLRADHVLLRSAYRAWRAHFRLRADHVLLRSALYSVREFPQLSRKQEKRIHTLFIFAHNV